MNKLPIIGILLLMLLVISGYVSSMPADEEEVQVARAETSREYLDPHVKYYEEHLIRIGLEPRKP